MRLGASILKLQEICELIGGEILAGDPQRHVEKIMASDLMSDVLAFCCSRALLVTGLTNHQTVRTADVLDLSGILFTRGKRPSDETIRIAKSRNIPLLRTDLSIFHVCGVLYSQGLSGI